MKDLKDMLHESLVLEASTKWSTRIGGSETTSGLDACNCAFTGNKKYGFVVYMENEETVALTAVDSAKEWAEPYDMEEEDVAPAFKLSVGESTKMIDDSYVMRIW